MGRIRYVTFAPSFMSLEADKKHEKTHGNESATPSQPSQPKSITNNVTATSEINSTPKTTPESPKK
ncbi:predicted protein [Histoplasma mississippiense (nom. inval.)]|uniref:predicted protein n=1 Tax=Ajellomyces capsulatus (strain NAm1 / WU24) TaxID=2059318 RepID=UPI000157C2FA|nr:predicted protein [Histoplasma mississippiense (nom. inval.)]EDN07237.1 predicted protein [Histoplasma mississippiense (nom. inval.)]